MDQGKIGRFIAACRKEQGLTQLQLGEQLGITDRAVSKWETGRAMPDCGLIPDLCAILHISISALFCGEAIAMENYSETLEKKLLEMAKEKEEADRRWLALETVVGLLSMLFLFSMVFTAAFAPLEDWLRVVLIVIGFVSGFIGIFCALRIEQVAGYYACAKCGHRYVPAYKNVLWAMHCGRTRYMKVPALREPLVAEKGAEPGGGARLLKTTRYIRKTGVKGKFLFTPALFLYRLSPFAQGDSLKRRENNPPI